MNNKEKAIAAAMLDELSNELGNKCCNDWSFPDSWTEEEKANFVMDFHVWNGDPEEFDINCLFLSDHSVASFLAHKILNDKEGLN